MTAIQLRRNYDQTLEVKVIKDMRESDLDPRLDLASHSPEGFEVGYLGTGPSQLALAILAEVFDDDFAKSHYVDYLKDIIAQDRLLQPGSKLLITEDSLKGWAAVKGFIQDN